MRASSRRCARLSVIVSLRGTLLTSLSVLQELLALRKEFDAQQALLNRYTANPGLQTPAAGAVVEDPMEAAGKESGIEEATEEEGERDEGGERKKEDGGMSHELGKVEKPV